MAQMTSSPVGWLAALRSDEEAFDALLDSAGTGHSDRESGPLAELEGTSLLRPGGSGRRNRSWDPELVADLGLACVEPPGYRRRARGWVRARSGAPVPGARDRTLRRSWPPATDVADLSVRLFDTLLAERTSELAWVAEVAVGSRTVIHDGGVVRYLEVPAALWERVADAPLGLEAPELCAEQLVDVSGAARLLGVAEQTIRAYKARGRLPDPQATFSGGPVWSRPVLLDWERSRR